MQHDATLGAIIRANGTIALRPPRPYFESLARSIVSQQISVKAAAKIFDRFKNATALQPHTVLQLNDSAQKEIGLSNQKMRYLRDLAFHFAEDSAVFNHLDTLSDDEAIRELTRIKGIGVWTAQMFLQSTLHRPDIFAPDDRGLQLALLSAYDFSTTPARSELEKLAEQWRPYRTTACLHLWRSLNNEPAT